MYNADSADWEPVIMGLSSTQLKKSKRWMTTMKNLKLVNGAGVKFTPPMFSHIYEAATIAESNDQGTWRGLEFKVHAQVTDPEVYANAKAFRDMMTTGDARAAYESVDSAAAM